VVKIQFRITKKRYKPGRKPYESEEVTINFPKDLHNLLRYLDGKKVALCGHREGKKVHLVLWDQEDP
jgi:hypothetical protein